MDNERMETDRRGWFADPGDEDEDDYDAQHPWRPYLQAAGLCVPLRMWFATKAECEEFIRTEVLGAEMLPDL